MSVVLKSQGTGMLGNVFIFYDFNQIQDAIMIVAFIESIGNWQKIFVYKSETRWEFDILADYFEKSKREWICKKLNVITDHRERSSQFGGIDIEKDMKTDSDFVIGLHQAE